MKLNLKVLCAFPTIAILACSPVRGQNLESRIDQYMQASTKVDHFMGSVLVAQHGKIILSKGYGLANVEAGTPNTPDTEFRIGSVTKEFTAMAIVELQAKGKLNVQDPVCNYVPDCPKEWAPIKIFNLLTHTSGIPNFTAFPNYPTVETEQVTPTQLLALFKDKPLDFTPGTKFAYSNSGYEVLGYIIERVSGESYQDFLEKNIFDPLEMTDTGYDKSHPTAKNHAQGYSYSSKGYAQVRFVNTSVPFSAGALYSTVLDLYKWDRAVHGGKLIPKTDMDEMLTPHVAMGDPEAPHYGFGWMISTEFGHKEIWHGGGIEGFTSLNSWFPDDDAYIIVLDNMSSGTVGGIGRSLAAILFGQKYEIPEEHKAITLQASAMEKFIGQYQLAPKFILTVREEGDQLITQATGQGPVPIFPESPNEFFAKLVDAQISFVQGPDGKVTGLVLHQNGRDVPASRISSTVPPLPTALSLSPDLLAKYVGDYQLAPNFAIAITLAGDQLKEQATGQPAFPIFPESKTEFFLKVVDAKISFVEDSNGQVTGLVLHQGGRDVPGKRIK